MVELSTAFGVLCRFTAIVAIDPRHPDRKPEPAALRRIVQPVDFLQHVHCLNAAGPIDRHSFAVDSLGARCISLESFLTVSPADPMDEVRTHAEVILANARPKSGAIDDLNAGKVRILLKAVLALLRRLGESGAPSETIASLATAYGRLYAMPADRDAIVVMLDELADIAELSELADHWWRAAPVDTGSK
jgi:hypothetical protein